MNDRLLRSIKIYYSNMVVQIFVGAFSLLGINIICYTHSVAK